VSSSPKLVFLAGPNGAGKSTFHRAALSGLGLPFLNADEFQRESGVTDAEAQAFLDAARETYLRERRSFITETVFSDPVGAKLRFLQEAIHAGYEVWLIYLGLDSPEACDARVVSRVLAGGHDVPAERITRRYAQSLKNLQAALTFVSHAEVYDNSGEETDRHLVMRMECGKVTWRKDVLPEWLARVVGQNFGR
jgi:predicted ABC-type ATPase